MQIAKHVKFREEKFGGVLFETRSEKVYTLNPSAAAVLRAIKMGGDESSITRRLKEEFSDGAGILEREVATLIGELRQKGLVHD
jgi:hypothetical protein